MTNERSRTFDEDKPLKAGAVVEGVVIAHHPWGAEVLIDDVDISGVIEITKILDDRPFSGPADLPDVGTRLRVVVLGYTPAGQLRLSLLRKDLETAASPEDEE